MRVYANDRVCALRFTLAEWGAFSNPGQTAHASLPKRDSPALPKHAAPTGSFAPTSTFSGPATRVSREIRLNPNQQAAIAWPASCGVCRTHPPIDRSIDSTIR